MERMRILQTGCPTPIAMAGIIRCKSDAHAALVERRFHEFFAPRHTRGEWFKCTDHLITQIWEILNRLADGGDVRSLSALEFERLTSRA